MNTEALDATRPSHQESGEVEEDGRHAMLVKWVVNVRETKKLI